MPQSVGTFLEITHQSLGLERQEWNSPEMGAQQDISPIAASELYATDVTKVYARRAPIGPELLMARPELRNKPWCHVR